MKLNYSDGLFIITLDEKLDASTALEASDMIQAFMEDIKKDGSVMDRVMIDADRLKYISSAGIRILVELKRNIPDMKVKNVSHHVYEIISISGLETILGLELKDNENTERQDITKDSEPRPERNGDVPSDFIPVTKRFEEQVRLHPKKKAVISTKGSFTYKKLNETANKVANSLIFAGAKTEDIVCIMLERGIEVYAATIGALKAGCAYIVVNPRYPDERIEYIYRDSKAKFIISSLDMVYERLELFVDVLQKRPLFYEHILSSKNVTDPDTAIYPGDLCYIIYTSGSTGKPKGVMIEHGNLSNFLIDDPANREFQGLAKKSRHLLAMAQMTFDISVMEEFVPLVTGNTVVFALYEEIANPSKMTELMTLHNVDGAVFTPSYLLGLLKLDDAKEAVGKLKVIDVGSEAFPDRLYNRIRECNPDAYIMNGYGPTETTISCTMKVIEGAEDITIGVPNANVETYVIDEEGNEVPKGDTGELLITGRGVGRGYVNLPEKTAASFILYKGRRAYKSGDMVRINDKGEIEFFGRKDHQVKIRGLRIELGEVESVFSRMEGVDIPVAASIDDRYLCLYYTSQKGLLEKDLRAFAKEHLAHYMLPDIYVRLDEMPMTDNKKADRKALPIPEIKEESIREPETEIQRDLMNLLNSVIEDRHFGTDQNLPEAGMSSLDVMLFISLIGNEYDIGINIGDFVKHPTILELEQFIEKAPKLKHMEKLDRYHASEVQVIDYNEALTGGNDLDLPMIYEMDRDTDTERLKEAIYKAMASHPGLTSRLERGDDNVLYQIPRDDPGSYEIRTYDIDDADLEEKKRELCVPIPPDSEWLFRFGIIITPSKKYLFTNYNHLVSDGESMSVMTEDIIAAYEGRETEPEQLTALEYGEYLALFKDTKAGKICLDIYMKYFEASGGAVTYPADKNEGKWTPKHLEIPLTVSGVIIREFCTSNRFTESTLLAGALGIVLAEQTNRESLAFAFGYSGRSDSRLSNTVGYIATALEAFCFPGKHDSYTEYLRDFDMMLLNIMTFPAMPVMEIFETYPNAFDVFYIYQPYVPDEYEMDGHKVRAVSLQDTTVYENKKLIIQPVQGKDGGITWQIDYQGNLYSEESMRKLISDLNKTVQKMITYDSYKFMVKAQNESKFDF